LILGLGVSLLGCGNQLTNEEIIHKAQEIEQKTPYHDDYSFIPYKIEKVSGNKIQIKSLKNAGYGLDKMKIKNEHFNKDDKLLLVFDKENFKILKITKLN